MISKNNKKFILSGILLAVAVTFYSLTLAILSFYYGNRISLIVIVFNVIPFVALILYCFVFNKTKWNKIIYYIGFSSFALLYIYFCLPNIAGGYFDLNTLSELLFFAVTIVMIVTKVKQNKRLFIVGTVVLGFYAIIQIIAGINDLISGFPSFIWLTYGVYKITQFIAIFNIWLTEGGIIIFKNKVKETVKMTPEDNLVSLKQLYDSGDITEQEYNEKKTEILNNL